MGRDARKPVFRFTTIKDTDQPVHPLISTFVIRLLECTRGDQKVRGKVLLNHIAFINCNENSQMLTTIHCKLTEIVFYKM